MDGCPFMPLKRNPANKLVLCFSKPKTTPSTDHEPPSSNFPEVARTGFMGEFRV